MAKTDIADVPESAQFQFQSADNSDVMVSGPEQSVSESRERIRH